jgi:hypothetical protein
MDYLKQICKKFQNKNGKEHYLNKKNVLIKSFKTMINKKKVI